MHNGVSAAVTAMEQAVRRLDAALAKRAAAFRSLSEQHGAATAELRDLREQLQAARNEAASLRERADLADALRAELAQIHAEDGAPAPAPAVADDEALHRLEQLLAARDSEIAALKDARDALQQRLAAALAAQEAPKQQAPAVVSAATPAAMPPDVTALKAELSAARAAQAEMQAFQSGIAARLEVTMARLRQALDAEAAGQR